MNRRKLAFKQGLTTLRAEKKPLLTRKSRNICAIRPSLYNAAGMPDLNQIINGDSTQILNDGPEGWVDLVFADPPFNIGYLYHNYDDEKDVDEYVNWSENWMRAVYRALKPSGSFYLAIGDYNRAQFQLYRALGNPAQALAAQDGERASGAPCDCPAPSAPPPTSTPLPAAAPPSPPIMPADLPTYPGPLFPSTREQAKPQ